MVSTSLTIDGSETLVTATGGNDDGADMGSIGIQSPAITIKAGTVTATGGNGGTFSADGSLAVVCTDNTLNVTGGKLIANGGSKAAGGTPGSAIGGLGVVYTLTGVSFYQSATLPVDTSTPGTTPCTMQYVVIQ